MKDKKTYIILGQNNTYYKCMTGIGPAFGATLEETPKMTKEEANNLVMSFPFMVIADIMNLEDMK